MDQTSSYKYKQEVLETLFKQYRIAKFRLSENKYLIPSASSFVIKDNNTNYGSQEHRLIDQLYNDKYYEEFVNYVDHALQCLNSRDELIIRKTYLEQDSKWWVSYYTRPTYYRNRKNAINEIFEILFPR